VHFTKFCKLGKLLSTKSDRTQ